METGSSDFSKTVAERQARLRHELASLPSDLPLVLEIGCGHGHFLNSYAAECPGKFFLGIDVLRERVERAEKKRRRAALENLRFIKCEASECLLCLPDSHRLAEVFLLFPDPWPKRRHHKKRLLRGSFLRQLRPRMSPEGRLYFRTDFLPYLQAAAEEIRGEPGWQLVEEAAWPHEEITVFQTKALGFGSLVAAFSPAED